MNHSVSTSDRNLYINFYKYINFYAFKLTGNYSYAEDLTHDAFTSYFANKTKVSENPAAIKSFLYSSVRNKIINEHKRTKVNDRYWQKTGFNEQDSLELDRVLIYTELLAEVERLVNNLPAMCRKVIKLSFFEGLSNSEIKDNLNISINTVKTHKKRGLAYLQKNLNPEYYLLFVAIINQELKLF